MMMKILAEGGLPVVSDRQRSPDMDNPNGYFELERVKYMSAGNVAWLADAGGKAVKIISALLEFLPSNYVYRVIFMEREIQEIMESQRKMLEHRNETSRVDEAHIEEQLRKHLGLVKPWLARQPNMEALYISYNALLSNPEPSCRRVMEFIRLPLDLEGMLSVPDGNLYRSHM
ncbi:MAG TPA: hypothetical protein VJ785_02680 [Anaerolineales bacterium]|nr:hypothetical protein [Anaerolineales bacterium]